MPKKYQKPQNKNRKYTHNRPYHEQWWEYGKERTKEVRKYMKMLRHKLLFHIPLTEEEEETVKRTGLNAYSALDRQGYVRNRWDNCYVKSERWTFMNPKEDRENFGKPQKKVDKKS